MNLNDEGITKKANKKHVWTTYDKVVLYKQTHVGWVIPFNKGVWMGSNGPME